MYLGEQMKKNQLEGNYFKSTENEEFAVPQETLQTYYKDAYMRERDRFNSMFGTIEYNPPYERPIYPETETLQKNVMQEDMVPKKKLKKSKRALSIFIVLTIIAIGAAVYFASKAYGWL